MIQNNPPLPSFPRRRESSENNNPQIGRNPIVGPLRGNFSINWIPAFAGMTHWLSMGKFGMMNQCKTPR